MFSLFYAWTNGWITDHVAGDLRCRHAHYDIAVMFRTNVGLVKNMFHINVRPVVKLCNVVFMVYGYLDKSARVIFYHQINTPLTKPPHCIPSISLIGCLLYPPHKEVVGGYTGFTPSVRLSVCPSVRLSRMPCPLCIIYSYGWILFILGTNDHYHKRVCRAPWLLTLTYIFKVIRPWLRKWCPLCSVFSSGWILSIFGTNDHYH